MSGFAAVGGSVNYVNREPHTGPIKNELDTSFDSLGTYRTHFRVRRHPAGPGIDQRLDYRFDITQAKLNSFIDGDFQSITNLSTQVNYRVNDTFKVWARSSPSTTMGTPIGARR